MTPSQLGNKLILLWHI